VLSVAALRSKFVGANTAEDRYAERIADPSAFAATDKQIAFVGKPGTSRIQRLFGSSTPREESRSRTFLARGPYEPPPDRWLKNG